MKVLIEASRELVDSIAVEGIDSADRVKAKLAWAISIGDFDAAREFTQVLMKGHNLTLGSIQSFISSIKRG